MTVDSTLLEAGRFHQVIEGAALVPSLIENRRCCLHDLFPGLLAFGHKAAFADETGRSFPIIALRFAWMLIATEWSQAEHSPRILTVQEFSRRFATDRSHWHQILQNDVRLRKWRTTIREN